MPESFGRFQLINELFLKIYLYERYASITEEDENEKMFYYYTNLLLRVMIKRPPSSAPSSAVDSWSSWLIERGCDG